MADETQKQPDPQWLDKLWDADSVRNYGPIQGLEEPGQAPPGRASASVQQSDTAQPEDNHASPADQDG